MKELARSEWEKIFRAYPTGSRVVLEKMDDPQAPPIGTIGTIQYIDDMGSIGVRWDTGSCLAVVYGEDRCRIVEQEEEDV